MKNYRRISLFVLCIALFTAFSLFAFADSATEHKVVCTYDAESNILKADIYVSNGTAIVGYCSFDYDHNILTLIDKDKKEVPADVPAYSSDGKTLYLKDIFESHGGIVVTDIGNGTKKLINTTDGYAMFAWYFSDSNAVIDASENEVLISSVSFKLKDEKTVSDITESTLTFASKEITDKVSGWYPAIFVMDKNHKQYSYADGTLKAEIVFNLSENAENTETANPDETKDPENTDNTDNSDNTDSENTSSDNRENENKENTDNQTPDNQVPDESTEPDNETIPDEDVKVDEPEKKPEITVGNTNEYNFGLSFESTETTLRLKWNRPEDFAVDYYIVTLSDTDGNIIRYIDGIASVTGSYTLRELAQDFTYSVTLCAYDENGNRFEQSNFEAKTLRFEGTPEILTHTITYDAGEGFIYGLAEETVVFGKTAEKLPDVIAPEGLYFVGWSENGSVPFNAKNARVYSDRTYYAIYTDHPEVYTNGYISGYDDGTFKPEGTLNRAESAALFARVAGGYDDDAKYRSSFSDIKDKDWYKNAVAFCSENGYIGGYEDGSFRPLSTITRAEFVTIVCRIFGFEDLGSNDYYTDISSHWAKQYINALCDNCPSVPFKDDEFSPDKKITRREAVLVLNSALGIIPDRDSVIEYVQKNGTYGRIFGDVSLSDPDFFEIAQAAIGKQ